jgi:hypothetical protein
VEEHVSTKHEALSSIPSTIKNKTKKERKRDEV